MSMDGLLLLFAAFGGFGALSTHKETAMAAFLARKNNEEDEKKKQLKRQLNLIQIHFWLL